MRKPKKEKMYRVVTESGINPFNDTYSYNGANTRWEWFNGIYTFDDGHQEYLYIEEV